MNLKGKNIIVFIVLAAAVALAYQLPYLRYNFYGRHYLTAMYNFMAHLQYLLYYQFSLPDAFDFSVQGAGLKYSYASALGPISLTANWSKTNVGQHFGLYFSFGYTF